MAKGEVLFDIRQGYDEDMWDDRALIRNYERAYKASRELKRRREEAGSKQRPVNWAVGDACRVLYSEDGLEYEGSIVSLDHARRRVVVRLHGYNQEIEVRQSELEASLGQEAIELQIEEAAEDLGFEEEEESFEGEPKVGDFCRARWSLDDRVYEGVIVRLEPQRKKARVRFVGYGNEETVDVGQLLASKGEDWREGQEMDADQQVPGGEEEEEALSLLLGGECQVLLDQINHSMDQLTVADTTTTTTTGSFTQKTADKRKHKEEKAAKKKTEKSRKSASTKTSTADHSSAAQGSRPLPPPGSFWSSLGQPQDPTAAESQFRLPPMPPPPPCFSSQIPLPPFVPSLPPLGGTSAAFLPPPPTLSSEDLDFINTNSEALHSMLMSWYLAGYHSGYYQGIKLAAAAAARTNTK